MWPWFKTALVLLLAVMPGGLLVLAVWALWGAWQRGGLPALRRELRQRLAPWKRPPPGSLNVATVPCVSPGPPTH